MLGAKELLNSTPLSYDFLAPSRIVFGWGRWREVAALAARWGRRAFVVLGSRTLEVQGFGQELSALLAQQTIETVFLDCLPGEPTVESVDQAARQIRGFEPGAGDFVLAIGGGSALDLGKALAALATNRAGNSVRDYLEGVGCGRTLDAPPLPLIAMPTTAGTGSEATKNAVISVTDPAVKKSLRADELMPRVVVVDPELAVTLPATITAYTGLDALTQCLESYVSCRAKPIPEAFAAQGTCLALHWLVEAVEDGTSRPARENMAHAALLSGLALANSGLGMAHGVAAALGVHAGVPHGLACAVMLGPTLRANREVALSRLATLSRLAGLTRDATDEVAADELIRTVEQICLRVNIPQRLTALGVRREQIPQLVRDSRGNSMDGNPRRLADDELGQILEDLL